MYWFAPLPWAAAQQAAADAEAQVAEQKRASAELYAQLASLKNTTASLEQQYQEGLAWEAAQNAVKTPPTAPVINPNPPAPVGSSVEGAIAFAKAQLGEGYLHGMNGIAEGVRQLRGTSVNPVPDVEHVLVTAGTGVPTSGVILG